MANEGTNRTARGNKESLYDILHKDNSILKIGEVISITDPNDMGRIKVRIKGPRNRGGDDGISDSELAWCFPMIPKFISTQPKVKEAVYIFVFDKDREFADRMYIGPIISQQDKFNSDPYYLTAIRGFTFSSEHPNISISTIPQLKGVFPNPEDVSIQGRYNTDITQKNNEIVIRAGKFKTSTPDKSNPYPFTYNAKTQAYIQIKNDVVLSTDSSSSERTGPRAEGFQGLGFTTQDKGTITNIVANKINLLTHNDGSPRFDLTNNNNLISDEEMTRILDEAHQLVFGDILLQYLEILESAVLSHVHNGHGNTPTDLTGVGNKQSVANFKQKAEGLRNVMLSKNIRIN